MREMYFAAMVSPKPASTHTSGMQIQEKDPVENWKKVQKTLTAMKEAIAFSSLMKKPHAKSETAMKKCPHTKMVLLPRTLAQARGNRAVIALTRPMITVPVTGVIGNSPPDYCYICSRSLLAQIETALKPESQLNILRTKQVHVALLYCFPHIACPRVVELVSLRFTLPSTWYCFSMSSSNSSSVMPLDFLLKTLESILLASFDRPSVIQKPYGSSLMKTRRMMEETMAMKAGIRRMIRQFSSALSTSTL